MQWEFHTPCLGKVVTSLPKNPVPAELLSDINALFNTIASSEAFLHEIALDLVGAVVEGNITPVQFTSIFKSIEGVENGNSPLPFIDALWFWGTQVRFGQDFHS